MLGSRVRAPEGAQKTRRQPGLYNEKRGYSSVGLERLLDRQEVTGSNPVILTTQILPVGTIRADLFLSLRGRTTDCILNYL